MSAPKAIIIGAGVSGLSAGCYLRASGFETDMFEMAPCAGGVSVSWVRKGYTFDAATNWLPGSAPSLNLYDILREVLDFSKLDIIEYDEFARIETAGGAVFTVWKDVERLEQEMLAMAPEDRAFITRLGRALRTVRSFRLPVAKAPEVYGLLDYVKVALTHWRLLLFILAWRGKTIEEVTAKLRSTQLRDCLRMIFPHHSFFSMLALVLPLGWMCMRATGYPMGGSRRLNDMLVERYTGLGGRIRFNCRVKRIITEAKRAVGVELADGTVVKADVVLSSADGFDTLKHMLDPALVPASATRRFGSLTLYPALLQISLGVRRTFEGMPNKFIMALRTSITAGAAHPIDSMIVRLCGFDPSLAPAGCTSVVVNLRTGDDDYWVRLRQSDSLRYTQEKQRVLEAVVDELEVRFGDIRKNIEVSDVATPATYVRYTNTWHGSYQGWAPTPKMVGKSLPKTIPGVLGFYMCGQWVEVAGGLPRAVLSARNAVQIMCRDMRRTFSVPA